MDNTQQIQRYTLHGVLLYKFLRWVDKKEMKYIVKTMFRYCMLVVMLAAVPYHTFMLGVASRAIVDPSTVLVVGILVLFFYGKAIVRTGRKKAKSAKGNQNTFHGVPITELATFLFDTGGFKNEAVQKLGLAQKQWSKMAKALDDAGIVYKSAEHFQARVLRPITREQLITQLRDNFPLIWSESKQDWIGKDGSWRSWLADEEREEQKHKADIARLQRRKKKVKKEIDQIAMSSAFTRREVALV